MDKRFHPLKKDGIFISNGYIYQISFNGTTVWQLTTMDDYGRTRQAAIGTTTASWTYDANNQLSQVAATGVQRYDYSFDANTGNLGSRANYLKSLSESFWYDATGLDRLDSVSGPSVQKLAYTSNNNGNILTKSDAGAYSYGGGPYSVSGIANALNIDTARQAIEYYSFERVKQITEGTKTAEFVYNPDGQRIRMILKTSGTTAKTRWYFGGSCEREEAAGVVTQFIWVGGDAYTAPVMALSYSGTTVWLYLLRDYLGNITHITSSSGSVLYEYSYDACSVKLAFRNLPIGGKTKSIVELIPVSVAIREGRRRDKDTWGYSIDDGMEILAGRGFTAHEFLPWFNLYNMNGRMYDPVVGRFLSVDNYVQNPDFSQSYNRYSYAYNNPLLFTDSDGEFPWLAVGIYAAFTYLKAAHDNRDPETGKWDWGLKRTFSKEGSVVVGIKTNTDFTDATAYVGAGSGPYIPAVSYNNNYGVGIGYYSPQGTNFFYPGYNPLFAEQKVNQKISEVTQAASGGISYFDNALKFEGTPYLYGGMTEKGIDCSGLINRATGNETRVWSTSDGVPPGNWNKVNAKTDSYDNFKADLMRGDLLLWKEHAAFYGGGNDLFHAQRTGTNVGYTHDLYWWLKNKGYPNAYREY